jgi:solute carrier family 35 (UDP-xylose/UDP-N-acetylglucosamine transporter), member B4
MEIVRQSECLTRLDSQNKAMEADSPPAKSANGTVLEDRLEGLRKRNTESLGHEKRMRESEEDSCRDTIIAVAHTFLLSWLSMAPILALIFGGCCANVFALEAIIQAAPNSGTLITATQFLLTSLFTLSSHLDLSRGVRHPHLRPRSIPFHRWLIYTAFFLTINILNNAAFGYKISVPLHIILRSAGPVATMAVGYFYGKQYTRLQALAVLLLFLGVVQAAIADAQAKGAEIRLLTNPGPGRSTSEFWTGFGILFIALVLSAVMGVFTDNTYAKYGRNHTEENLFYSHTLSLPFFLLRIPELRSQSQALFIEPSPLSAYIAAEQFRYGKVHWFHVLAAKVPTQVVYLLLNACTQYLCIKGVNQLSARSSSLTVGVVLNIRKLASLLLSIWLFGNRLAPGVLIGAVIVFVGGGLYALPSSKPKMAASKGASKEESKKEL